MNAFLPMRRNRPQEKLFRFFVLLAFLVATVGAHAGETGDGENLVHLQSGVVGPLSYGLYRGAPPANRIPDATTCDLILVVRNLGDKAMNLSKLRRTDFVLFDTITKDNVNIDLVDTPRSIGFGRSAVIHLSAVWWARGHQPMPQTGVLTVKANAHNLLSEDLVIGKIPLDSGRLRK
jgi:hypothetical protein